jgi:hypothetical protein
VRGKVLACLAALALAWAMWPDGKRYPPGVLISTDPSIELVEQGSTWTYSSHDTEYELTQRARYHLEARVLSINLGYGDSLIGPADITVGWGPMSDQQVLDRMQIWQDNTRHWYCRPRGDWPIPSDQVALHAVNTHVIPSSSSIARQVEDLHKGDLIRVDGSLVNVSRRDGFHWNTSVDPSGFGEHSCKIIWLESLSKR